MTGAYPTLRRFARAARPAEERCELCGEAISGAHRHLLEVHRRYRKTIVFITHDLDEAIYLADTVVVMTTRPGTVKQITRVNLARPRVPEMLYSHEYAELKRSAAESVHEEALRAFERGEKEQA